MAQVSGRNWSIRAPGSCRPFVFCCRVWLFHERVGAPVRVAVEADHAPVVHGPVDDGGGHVRVAEHASPAAGLDVRGEDHALTFVCVGGDLEQQTAAFLIDGHVAELVDDQEPRLADHGEFLVEPVVRFGAQQAHDQSGGGEEARLRAFPACFAAEGDGQVRLARAGRPEQDHVLVPPGEFERLERLAPVIDREADRCPVVPVEFLGLGEPGLSQQARAFRAPAGRDLLAHPCLHERHLRRGRLLQAVGEDLPGQRQAAREFHDRLHPAPGRGAPDAKPVSANDPPSAHTS